MLSFSTMILSLDCCATVVFRCWEKDIWNK